ncbi:MAG TPA: CrcB family protein [Mycobacteriales bacterium]|nr:CrcB family protein [Mycobacteriales bacterium]
MTHSRPAEWPIDPDVTAEDIGRPRPHHRPSLDPARLALVMVGGFLGGLVRYEVVDHWATSRGDFPWSTFAVNTAGAFVLGVVVIVALDVLAGSRYLRPLMGTGLCGALTTFSSVAVEVDQLLRHGHVGLGVTYLLGSLAAGLAAAALGATIGRALPPSSGRRRLEVSS